MNSLSVETIFYAILGGVLPALIWLWFWYKEDSKNPEPKKFIILTFIAGMFVVPLVIPFEQYAQDVLNPQATIWAWAAIEELLKFAVAYFVILYRKDIVDEPVDVVIYMLTIALGFAAAENALFLLKPLTNDGFLQSILTGNFRFLGATLLHVLASSTIGVAMALAFYKTRVIKLFALLFGVSLSIVIHGAFNYALLNQITSSLLEIFAFVWLGLIFLLLAFEKIKRIKAVK